MLNREQLQESVLDILRNKIGVSADILARENWHLPLTGIHFKFSAVSLVFLLFEIEKTFNIRIHEEYFESYGFYSINSVLEALENCINEKGK